MIKDKNKEIVICKICESEMEEYCFAYDNKQYGKIYYKCNVCGNKINFIK